MFTNDRDAYRKFFFISWQKYLKKLPMDLEETRLIEVILDHPEFHAYLEDPDTHLRQEYTVEENPFLHMSLHIALRDQLRLDRPEGIQAVYEDLLGKYEPLKVEHLMIECLQTMLKKGQETGEMPGDQEYLVLLSKIK